MTESNIKVAIRLRPSLPGEISTDLELIETNERNATIKLRNSTFSFDHVFSEQVSNEDVYTIMVSKKIKYLFDGYNCTVLAYGSTGSGKTFTMGTASKGEDTHDGLIPLALKDIFNYSNSVAHDTVVAIKASFFEVYMESVKDLLKTGSSFVLGDSKEGKVTSMTEVTVTTYNDAIDALKKGVQARTTGVTARNIKSSRSHAFFIITLTMTNRNNGISKFSKFQLVDLAGSERTGIDTTGKEFKQGVQINKGLTALGRVISSLSQKEKHIPYRDSVLTKYLQDSLGGNSHTVMVTCISPALTSVEETLSSLRYSSVAKKIENTPIVNQTSSEIIKHLKSELKKLQSLGSVKEINDLNKDLAKAHSNSVKIREELLKFLNDVNSLEDKMVSETFCMPGLINYIEILRHIKEDLNKLIEKKELFSISAVENMAVAAKDLDAHPEVSFKDKTLTKAKNIPDEVDDKFLELKMKNYEHLKVLCDFLRVEEEHSSVTKKLEDLLHARKQLAASSSNEIDFHDKIQALDKEIQREQQHSKLCSLAVERCKFISMRNESLKQRFQELKNQQKRTHLNVEAHGKIWRELSVENKIRQLEEEMEEFDENDLFINFNPDEVDIWPMMLNRFIRREVRREFMDWKLMTIPLELPKPIPNKEISNDEQGSMLERRLSACRKKYRVFVERQRTVFSKLDESDTRNCFLTSLFEKMVRYEAHPLIYDAYYTGNSRYPDQVEKLKSEVIQMKEEMDILEKQLTENLMDLNTEWNAKTLLLLESAKRQIHNEKNGPPRPSSPSQSSIDLPDMPLEMSKFLQELWNKRDNMYERKCQEVDELKEKLKILEEENQKLHKSQLKLPKLTARTKASRNKEVEFLRPSMIEAFLNEEEEDEEIVDSERFDPDYRATPIYKRNRPKRKLPEDDASLMSPKPPKALSASGCSCPSDCGTMRCSCKKKNKSCCKSCECSNANCLNTNTKNEF